MNRTDTNTNNGSGSKKKSRKKRFFKKRRPFMFTKNRFNINSYSSKYSRPRFNNINKIPLATNTPLNKFSKPYSPKVSVENWNKSIEIIVDENQTVSAFPLYLCEDLPGVLSRCSLETSIIPLTKNSDRVSIESNVLPLNPRKRNLNRNVINIAEGMQESEEENTKGVKSVSKDLTFDFEQNQIVNTINAVSSFTNRNPINTDNKSATIINYGIVYLPKGISIQESVQNFSAPISSNSLLNIAGIRNLSAQRSILSTFGQMYFPSENLLLSGTAVVNWNNESWNPFYTCCTKSQFSPNIYPDDRLVLIIKTNNTNNKFSFIANNIINVTRKK